MLKYRMIAFFLPALLFLSFAEAGEEIFEGTGYMDYAGYSGCIFLENKDTRVVLGRHAGGRILEYSLKGKNALYLDSTQDGWTYAPEKRVIDPCGGRLDIGPEMVIPKHPVLWLGEWEGEITGKRKARMTSRKDPATGVQLVRDVELDEKTSRLTVTQTIKNVSDGTKEYCHWSRTLVSGGGICIVPLTPNSRFPKSYIMYRQGAMNYVPDDPRIRKMNGYMIIDGPPGHPKLGFDSYAGWMAYIMKENMLFVKKYPVFYERVYNEMAAITSCVYYSDRFVELEPIGPREIIAPGKSASFTEEWRLFDYRFPEAEPPLKEIESFIKKQTGG